MLFTIAFEPVSLFNALNGLNSGLFIKSHCAWVLLIRINRILSSYAVLSVPYVLPVPRPPTTKLNGKPYDNICFMFSCQSFNHSFFDFFKQFSTFQTKKNGTVRISLNSTILFTHKSNSSNAFSAASLISFFFCLISSGERVK